VGNLGRSSRFGQLFSASCLLLLATCRPSHARSPGEPERCADRVAELEKWIVKYPSMDTVLRFRESGDGPDRRMADQDSPRVERDRDSPSVEMTPKTLRLGGSRGNNDRGTDIQHAREWLKSEAALKRRVRPRRPRCCWPSIAIGRRPTS